jgi:hypothetical protein
VALTQHIPRKAPLSYGSGRWYDQRRRLSRYTESSTAISGRRHRRPHVVLALDQQLASAAMHVYFVYQHFSEPEFNVIDKSLAQTTVPLEGFDLFYMGGRLYF